MTIPNFTCIHYHEYQVVLHQVELLAKYTLNGHTYIAHEHYFTPRGAMHQLSCYYFSQSIE